jgi:hypothetical protein
VVPAAVKLRAVAASASWDERWLGWRWPAYASTNTTRWSRAYLPVIPTNGARYSSRSACLRTAAPCFSLKNFRFVIS